MSALNHFSSNEIRSILKVLKSKWTTKTRTRSRYLQRSTLKSQTDSKKMKPVEKEVWLEGGSVGGAFCRTSRFVQQVG